MNNTNWNTAVANQSTEALAESQECCNQAVAELEGPQSSEPETTRQASLPLCIVVVHSFSRLLCIHLVAVWSVKLQSMARLSFVIFVFIGFLVTTCFKLAELYPPAPSSMIVRHHRRIDHQTLNCHVREFTFMAVNEDKETGLKCQGLISVNSCWGRCGSGEFSDYHFPFKKSYHLVCIHKRSEHKMFRLKKCDKGAPTSLRVYKAVVATECACQFCETSNTNCESAMHEQVRR